MFVNCQPARSLCWPVIAPAQAIVRAGNGGGKCGMRNWGAGGMSASGIALLAGRLPSVCAWQCSSGGDCVSVAAVCLGACPAIRFCRGALPRRMSGFAFLSRCFASVHACCLPHGDKQDGLRCVPFLFRRVEIAICAFSMRRRGYLPWRVHFEFGRFFMAISTSYRGTGLAARALCVFAQSHWL